MADLRSFLNIFCLNLNWFESYGTNENVSVFFFFLQFCEKTNLLNPKRPGLLEGVLFGEMKFVLLNFLSSEDLSISYES